jgi:hypothetical protein
MKHPLTMLSAKERPENKTILKWTDYTKNGGLFSTKKCPLQLEAYY